MIKDLSDIVNPMYNQNEYLEFDAASQNVLLETIISPHLQDELDIVVTDENDVGMTYFEIKSGPIEQNAVLQTTRYLSLLRAIFPEKKVFGIIIGSGLSERIEALPRNVKLVSYGPNQNGFNQFREIIL